MKRQGMLVTPLELIKLGNSLIRNGVNTKQKCIIRIINKGDASDTWEIENKENRVEEEKGE